MVKHVIFDLDQTLVDSSIALIDRQNRDWASVYSKIRLMKIFDGIHELLHFLDANSIEYSILTTSPSNYCNSVTSYFNIKPKHVVAYHDVKIRKPHPEGIFKIASLISASHMKDIIHIGDQANDIFASKNSGTISVGVMWGNFNNDALIDSKPEYIVSDPREIINIILELTK